MRLNYQLKTMNSHKIKFTIFFLLGIFVSTLAQPKLEIKDAKKNFGFVKKGEVIKILYEITNVGKEPLLLTNIEISCSCTTADYDRRPILPGQTNTVTVYFDTKTVYDRQDRVVLLESNDKNSPHKLRYKGVVLK
jgi:hypothetical protein